jgi:hypothetical protein
MRWLDFSTPQLPNFPITQFIFPADLFLPKIKGRLVAALNLLQSVEQVTSF